jgi:hypothetical protein
MAAPQTTRGIAILSRHPVNQPSRPKISLAPNCGRDAGRAVPHEIASAHVPASNWSMVSRSGFHLTLPVCLNSPTDPTSLFHSFLRFAQGNALTTQMAQATPTLQMTLFRLPGCPLGSVVTQYGMQDRGLPRPGRAEGRPSGRIRTLPSLPPGSRSRSVVVCLRIDR